MSQRRGTRPGAAERRRRGTSASHAAAEAELDGLVVAANRWVADVNADLASDDAFAAFDRDAARSAWRRLDGR